MEKLEELVKSALIKNKSARENDHMLYIEVAYMINPALVNINFVANFMEAKRNGLPNFESVSRAKRKIQEENPELKGSKENQAGRQIKQIEFEDYYKRKGVK